jgi:hypothetical protein
MFIPMLDLLARHAGNSRCDCKCHVQQSAQGHKASSQPSLHGGMCRLQPCGRTRMGRIGSGKT